MTNEFREKIRERMGKNDRVSESQIESELDRIRKKVEIPIIATPELKGRALEFDPENSEEIFVNIPETTDEVNRVLKKSPEINWKTYLQKLVEHELTHKNQFEYLKAHGVSIEEQAEHQYGILKEIHAFNAVPQSIPKKLFRQRLRKAGTKGLEKFLETEEGWAISAMILSRDEIREIFDPISASEDLINLKEVGEKVQSKEDIIKYAQKVKEVLRL